MNSAETDEVRAANKTLIQSLAASDGQLESPIDLDISKMKAIELDSLEWFNIDSTPKKLKLTNTGYTVLSANWHEEPPHLSGGPFMERYVFSQMHFHWGSTEMNGSEHYVDGGSMPMELHATYFKSEYGKLETALRQVDGATVVVYLFKLQPVPNPFIDVIVKSLSVIQTADTSVRLTPAPLSGILRPFYQDYFLYWGSIVTIHHTHNILWIISREPLGISVEQIAEFRTLKNRRNLPITSNCRPLKDISQRNVFHVCPSGSTYASLLPIPREALLLSSNESTVVVNTDTQVNVE